MSKHEEVVQAVAALVKAALPFAEVVRLEGEAGDDGKPVATPPGGQVRIFDGDPGDPEVILSPLTYLYTRRIPISLIAYESGGKSRREVINDMLTPIGEAIALDDTLGGRCDFIEAEAATFDDITTAGAVTERSADTAIFATYSTSSPLL
jgi:hypothetical protein